MSDITCKSDYLAEVQSIAEQCASEAREDERDVSDVVHETVDGHGLIIYTRRNFDVLTYSDNADAYWDQGMGGLEDAGCVSKALSTLAYCALSQDVMEAIGELDDPEDDDPEDDDPEDDDPEDDSEPGAHLSEHVKAMVAELGGWGATVEAQCGKYVHKGRLTAPPRGTLVPLLNIGPEDLEIDDIENAIAVPSGLPLDPHEVARLARLERDRC